MSLPAPPYTMVDPGQPEMGQHGVQSSFVLLKEHPDRVLLRMKGVFPLAGDTIADRVLEEATSAKGNKYLKLVKPSRNGSGGSQGRRGEAPDEAYWAGQNAAKGRAHAQEMALRLLSLYHEPTAKADEVLERVKKFADLFEKDVHAARDRAMEAERGAAPAPVSSGAAPTAGAAQPPSEPPTENPTPKQVDYMADLAKRQGLSASDMELILKGRFGVERFSEMPKRECVDRWKDALTKPIPDPNAPSDIPVDWPPEEPQPSNDDDDIPF